MHGRYARRVPAPDVLIERRSRVVERLMHDSACPRPWGCYDVIGDVRFNRHCHLECRSSCHSAASAQHCCGCSCPMLRHGGSGGAGASSTQGRGGAEQGGGSSLKGHYPGRFFLRGQRHCAGPPAVSGWAPRLPAGASALAPRLCLGVGRREY
jgi:hypothetical protein